MLHHHQHNVIYSISYNCKWKDYHCINNDQMFLLLLVLCCQYKRACYSICVYKYTGYMLLSVLTSFIFQLINIFIMIIELIKHQ